MVRPTRKSRTIQQLRRELGALLKLSPWVLAALLLVAVFWQADLAATTGLFQSPPTAAPPTPIPINTPPPVNTLPPLPTLAPTVAITPEATVELTPTAAFEATATLEPTATETPSPEATATQVPTATLAAEPTAVEGETQGRYAEGESGLRFEWGMLFDSVALGVSYLWLCCGSIVLVGIPIGFAVLWAASRRRRGPSE